MSGKQRRTGTVGGTIDVELLVQIAHLYYDEEMTQQKIAKKLNMSRSLVSKLLAKAKEKGIVKVTISDEVNRPHQPLEAQLKKLFGLSEVIITPADSGANNQKLA
ncbi:MAG: winged helix-turn-helix transcriptional regulator [Dorea sp.]|nr:winged helix-turn-helix transcriptional regulator [Dorea sp.]